MYHSWAFKKGAFLVCNLRRDCDRILEHWLTMSNEQRPPPARLQNMLFAVAAGQAGCFTLVIVVVALLAGMWLDNHFNVKGPFIIGLLLLSIPVSLFMMVRVALGSVKMIKPPPP